MNTNLVICIISLIIIIISGIGYERRIRLLLFERFKYKTKIELYKRLCEYNNILTPKIDKIEFVSKGKKFYAFQKE